MNSHSGTSGANSNIAGMSSTEFWKFVRDIRIADKSTGGSHLIDLIFTVASSRATGKGPKYVPCAMPCTLDTTAPNCANSRALPQGAATRRLGAGADSPGSDALQCYRGAQPGEAQAWQAGSSCAQRAREHAFRQWPDAVPGSRDVAGGPHPPICLPNKRGRVPSQRRYTHGTPYCCVCAYVCAHTSSPPPLCRFVPCL